MLSISIIMNTLFENWLLKNNYRKTEYGKISVVIELTQTKQDRLFFENKNFWNWDFSALKINLWAYKDPAFVSEKAMNPPNLFGQLLNNCSLIKLRTQWNGGWVSKKANITAVSSNKGLPKFPSIFSIRFFSVLNGCPSWSISTQTSQNIMLQSLQKKCTREFVVKHTEVQSPICTVLQRAPACNPVNQSVDKNSHVGGFSCYRNIFLLSY